MVNRDSPLTFVTTTAVLDGLKNPQNHFIWKQFIDRFQPIVVRWASHRGLASDDAQDAAQQTMLAFCEQYRKGQYERGKGRLRNWLFGIASNQISNAKKKLARREVQIVGGADSTGFFANIEDKDLPEDALQDWQDGLFRKSVEEVRGEVEERTMRAFELHGQMGYPAKLVAEQLGMTVGAVYMAKHHILRRIRQRVAELDDA